MSKFLVVVDFDDNGENLALNEEDDFRTLATWANLILNAGRLSTGTDWSMTVDRVIWQIERIEDESQVG